MVNQYLVYSQSRGELQAGGVAGWFSRGYSGHGAGMNNPKAQALSDVGPIPQGWYTIDAPIDPPSHLGPCAMPLIPDAMNEMFGRSGFYIHGDNAEMNHSASDGCIILPRPAREMIAARGPGLRLPVTK